jgi:purine-nucleoside phosphorylase
MGTDPFRLAEEAAESLRSRFDGAQPDVAVVLGSGWGPAADVLGDPLAEFPAEELPGFLPSTVPGHGGTVRVARAARRDVLIFKGRVHLYEGHDPSVVVHGVRTAILAGCRIVLLTNAAGSINADFPVGTPVTLSDHINLTARSPLFGPPPPSPYGIRFVDLSEAYSLRLRAIAREVDAGVGEGVYAALHGPNYETPAEIRMLRLLGADLVGMSTALECIAARHLGAEVMGLSLVTNLAAGLGAATLDHAEVVEAGAAAGDRVGRLLRGVIDRA